MNSAPVFLPDQLEIVNEAVAVAEELVSDHYKMSASQWLRRRFDIKTAAQLSAAERVEGPFAQVIRYVGQRDGGALGSATFDFYQICLQDHSILTALRRNPQLQLYPFVLYIVAHELIHVVRFSQFLQNFDASAADKLNEESRVHQITYDILKPRPVSGMAAVLNFYSKWRRPLEMFSGVE